MSIRLEIEGANNFIDRMYEACGPYQWVRETTKNALEANATKIEFGIEWQAVKTEGVYRRTISDNGCGMDSEELLRFFSKLGVGFKKIGSIHHNFGVGAKISLLPWNQAGVIVISYKNSVPSMIKIVYDADAEEYQLHDFIDEDNGGIRKSVIDPTGITIDDICWDLVTPAWAREHGTTIVLLGNTPTTDTVLGNNSMEEGTLKGISKHLNERFWDLSHVDLRVHELRSDKKTSWPTSIDETDDTKRINSRKIEGAKYHLENVLKGQKPITSGTVCLDDDRVTAHWFLRSDRGPSTHQHARESGYIAIRYKDELYELTSRKYDFRSFGIVEFAVQQNLTIILEPDLYKVEGSTYGIHPDQSRNRLLFTGAGVKGVSLPTLLWGQEFAESLPKEIRDALNAARPSGGVLQDEEYRKRLRDRFGKRWTVKALFEAIKTEEGKENGIIEDGPEIPTFYLGSGHSFPLPTPVNKPKASVMRRRAKLAESGSKSTLTAGEALDIPKYEFISGESFDNKWYMAMYDQATPDVVFLNQDAPVLSAVIKHHQDQYPPHQSDDVARIIRGAYGEIAVCKIAHTNKLARLPGMTLEQVNKEFRTPQALTTSLMGLIAEESLFGQRLGGIGSKKKDKDETPNKDDLN